MKRWILMPCLVWLVCGVVAMAQQDEFKRERRGDPARDKPKDELEGKAPPALDLTQWMNTDGSAMKLSDLKGKVVVIDFWGVW